MNVEIAFSPDGLSARLFIINIRFYESELNPNLSLDRSKVVFYNCLLSFAFYYISLMILGFWFWIYLDLLVLGLFLFP